MGGAIAAGATGAVAVLNDIEKSTEEVRVAMGKLNTAFEAAGMSTEAAATAYNEFYKILGDTDTATEASQLLAQLAENEQDLTKWTQIAAGVNGTFGDSLPIEALIESANETAKVGQVTGNLADALNWVGISEDEFNAKLAAASSESERNQLIMETLSGTYDEASKAFYKNNDALVKSRENQVKLDNALAKVGKSVATVKTNIMTGFVPSLSKMADGLALIVSGDNSGLGALNQGISEFIDNLSETVPKLLDVGANIVMTLLDSITTNIPKLAESATEIIFKLVDYVIEALPKIQEAAIQITLTLGEKLAEAAPQLITSVTEVILKLVDMLTNPEQLNKMLDVGLTLISTVGQALIDNVGKITEKIPEIVQNLVDFFLNPEQIGKVIDMGVSLLTSLISNTAEIINVIVGQLPVIIDGIVNALIGDSGDGKSNLEKIIDAGFVLITSLFHRMPSIIATLSGSIVTIIDKLKDKFLETDWAEVGKDIADSIWDGLKNAWDSLVEGTKELWQEFTNWIDEVNNPTTTHVSASGNTHGGGGGSFGTGGGGSWGNTQNVNINVYSPTEQNLAEIEKAGKRAAASLTQ